MARNKKNTSADAGGGDTLVIESADDLRREFPDLVTELESAVPMPEIESVEQLRTMYPDLVSQIIEERNEQLEEHIKTRTAEQFKEHFPDMHARIVKALPAVPARQVDLNVKGFMLETDDPFAEGTLRTFGRLTGAEGLHLPYVLPYKNPATREALVNYITRISSGDPARAKAAEDVLKKVFKTTYAEQTHKKKKKK